MAAKAATPATARLPETVDAAPVNLGGELVTGVVELLTPVGTATPVEAITGLLTKVETVAGQALTVTVTTDGPEAGAVVTGTELVTGTTVAGLVAGAVELLYRPGQLVTEAGQAVVVSTKVE